MPMTFKIHPAIGIARVGDSPDQFYLAPEGPGDLPIQCDASGVTTPDPQGVEPTITSFKDPQGRVKRQAARFRVFAYDKANPRGVELKVGDTVSFVRQRTGQLITAKLLDVNWTVYLANKKASWYQFDNDTGKSTSIGESAAVQVPRIEAPATLSTAGSFVRADVRLKNPAYPSWADPVHLYFRRTTEGWKLIGLYRTVI